MYQKVKVVGNVMPGFKDINLITTDKLGFRVNNSINYDLKIKTRIFTIGGSTTEEIYVDDKETWSYLLEKKLNKKGGARSNPFSVLLGTPTLPSLSRSFLEVSYFQLQIMYLLPSVCTVHLN